jgi:DNA primase
MLPIYNLTGEVMAFGGRAVGDEQPKYINTPNTPAYTKGQHAYALHVARRAASADDALIVVEGYLDAIALHQNGFANAVASLGTAFTPEQARELRRVAPNLYLCFDGDAAGQAATARSIDMLVEEGLNVRIVPLPAGKDPDEILLQQGADAFAAMLDASVKWVDFKIDMACRRIESSKFASMSDVAREALAVVSQVRDPIERDQYIKAMARRLDVSEEALRAKRLVPRGADQRSVAQARPLRATNLDSPIIRRAPATTEPLSLETELLKLVLSRPALLPRATQVVTREDFFDQHSWDVFATLLDHRDDIGAGLNPLSLFADERVSGDLTRLSLSAPPLSPEDDEQRLERALALFERRRQQRRLSLIDAEVDRLLNAGEPIPKTLRDEQLSLAESVHGTEALVERRGDSA